MNNAKLRLVVLGFFTWLIPFVVSFLFYDQTGALNVSYGFFKCVMIVTSSIVGMWALSYHLKFVNNGFKREGIFVGLFWLGINWLLDVIVLMPMSGMPIETYMSTVGLGYLQIPVTCIAIGMIMNEKFATNRTGTS